jgi:hypothetical protein
MTILAVYSTGDSNPLIALAERMFSTIYTIAEELKGNSVNAITNQRPNHMQV